MKVTAQYSTANIAKKSLRFVSASIQECGERALDLAIQKCPVVSGNLRDSLYMVMPTAYRFVIDTRAKYAKWVHNGRGWVFPVRKKCLHWVTPSGAKVFAAYSRPSRANPFMRRAVEQAVNEYSNQLEKKRWRLSENVR